MVKDTDKAIQRATSRLSVAVGSKRFLNGQTSMTSKLSEKSKSITATTTSVRGAPTQQTGNVS